MGNDQDDKVTLYVGCALTQASEEFRQAVAELKIVLRGVGFEILEFFDLKAGTPTEVTRHDLEQVENSDLMVGIADQPSLGLGAELMYRVRVCRKPTLVLAHADYRLSRFIEGMTILSPSLEIHHYRSWAEIPEIIRRFCEFHGITSAALVA